MSSILGRRASNKRKRSRFSIIFVHWVKNGSNNLIVTCKIFKNQGICDQALCKKAHKCKNCELKNYGQIECASKKKRKS